MIVSHVAILSAVIAGKYVRSVRDDFGIRRRVTIGDIYLVP